MPRRVREPIQVYLSEDERAQLDRAAQRLGVSRSEALRRGIAALTRPAGAASVSNVAHLTPPLVDTGVPPCAPPVASLRDLVAELRKDRDER
jgi:hypothetical protein